MKPTTSVHRGDVWLVKLDPTRGSEQRHTRPCVIVSNEHVNRFRRTAVVVPLTSARKFPPPLQVPVSFRKVEGAALPDQVRAIDRERLTTRLGKLTPAEISAIDESLAWVLDLPLPPESTLSRL